MGNRVYMIDKVGMTLTFLHRENDNMIIRVEIGRVVENEKDITVSFELTESDFEVLKCFILNSKIM